VTIPVALAPAERHWRDHARCLHLDPELFFPVASEAPVPPEVKAACGRCPVRMACLTRGIHQAGIWGGLTEAERDAWWRRQRRAGARLEDRGSAA
jgi:WhiB family transcriptional regulator, redox-sensing transcriptional regulator